MANGKRSYVHPRDMLPEAEALHSQAKPFIVCRTVNTAVLWSRPGAASGFNPRGHLQMSRE
jgi:hypothetical protein